MAKLSKKDVLHVADLSNLKLSDSEIKKFTPQLSKIVDFVGILSEVDTGGVEPTSQTTGLTNVLRDDNVKTDEALSQDEALSNTDSYNRYFKVPAILTERSLE